MSTPAAKPTSHGPTVALVGLLVVVAIVVSLVALPPLLITLLFTGGGGSRPCAAPGTGTSVLTGTGEQAPYTGKWINPIVGPLTSAYGMRTNPFTGVYEGHSGWDIAGPAHGKIHAAASGTVTIAGKSSGGNSGFMVAIDHGAGIQSRYVHMFQDEILVKVGQKVKVGDVIGLEGMSGHATGYHLHFEIRINGKPTDPKPWMAKKGVTIGTGPNSTNDASPSAASTDAEENRQEQLQSAVASQAVMPKAGGTTDASSVSYKSTDGELYKPSQEQWQNLQRVLSTVDASGMGKEAAVISIMVVLVESKGRIYANSTVPKSMNIPHQAVGSDHDSVGLFQQRPSAGWGSVKDLMDPQKSTQKFLKALKGTKDWKNMSFGQAAQTVQRSAVPDAYAKWESAATAIVNQNGSNFAAHLTVDGCGNQTEATSTYLANSSTATTDSGTNTPETNNSTTTAAPSSSGSTPQDPATLGKRIAQNAANHRGTPYLPGGRDPNQGWDTNGLVWWSTDHAGLHGIPYVDAYTAGQPTNTATPGDLVACGKQPDGTYNTNGIYAQNNTNTFYTVLPGQGTIETPIPTSCDYYTLTRNTP